MIKELPLQVWFAWINMGGGLHTPKPRRAKWDDDLESWWCGDYDVKKLGLDKRGGCTVFSSCNKELVQAFCDGANALREIARSSVLS